MILRAAAALGLLAGSLAAGPAAAQYYPVYPSRPYYPVYPAQERLVPPMDIDEEDAPVGSVPGDYERPGPRSAPSAAMPPAAYPLPPPPYGYGPPPTASAPYGPPPNAYPPYGQPAYPSARAIPGGIEQAPLPPPGSDPYAPSYQRPPAAASSPVPAGRPEQADTGVRPPIAIGPDSQQQALSPNHQQFASLPPDVRPETGAAKELPANLRRQVVDFVTKEPAGTIIIDTPNTYLYLVLGNGQAMRYGIGVGREVFTWSGTQRVARMAEWPDWHPPQEMIERQPYLPRMMAGGPGNPLGARALYLGNTIYRIHGTNQPSTIGQFVSSGCIRLLNEDVTDLYGRVNVGTRVVVLPGGSKPATASAGAPNPPVSVR